MNFRILVCDDSAIARKMVIRSLPAGLPAQVEQATDGAHALALLNSQHFDLLLLDLTMPQLDGLGVLAALKQALHEVFVLVVSGDVQPQMQARLRQYNTLGFLPKPVCADRLQRTLTQFGLY